MQTSSLSARDQEVIWHPYTQMQTAPAPIGIVRGEGALLFDEDNNSYIDATSSWWVNIHGHAHPHIAQQLAAQALQLQHCIFAGYTHPPAVNLAERLLQILPAGQRRVFYSDNGSTAVEVALKMALQYWDNKGLRKQKILAFKNAYHGDTFGAMSVSQRSVFTRVFDDFLFEVHFLDVPTPDNVTDIMAHIEALQTEQIAAFIFEPLLQGAGGMIMYDRAGFEQLLQYCRAKDILLIADEVMTGFGRTGTNFAMEQVSVQPDMICLSKGLTGGSMALGITTCTAAIYDAFLSNDKLKTLFHGHSFTANPLACSVALASLDLFTDPACKTNRTRINGLHTRFLETLQASPLIKNARLLGTILAFEITTPNADGYTNNLADELHRFFKARRIMLRPLGNTLYILPPYCITDEQLEQVYDSIRTLLVQLQTS
ncbi:adenosylmethionine--8-amino-7-oxononanoate transaminase [Chitinophaga nivalis]|uniref:Adenosylmethionine-8-amino-7-oxononanoate aminotransferase n=1 Tax=Chitinophaga nivalis TaxID=2991709 RepID=A0ABT3IQH3_9BACT|nr:adenosylmethionine--8-amino-7-oxononanoate transaminase [Chitinophaga nivalis]MCW3464099.1 adenosylmethionine--8-amino-7-oxononanoate transaminase [Chitinophaga nivalis]MCW3486211.1 adenosylmethionine--8-amino-7-oxononanoate transaminase [Chitinophaga nivalis]